LGQIIRLTKRKVNTKMAGKKKTEWEFDELIDEVREAGVPCNRTSFRAAAVSEFVKKRTNEKSGKVDVEGVTSAIKLYHAKNPEKAQKKIEKLKAKIAEMEAALEEAE